MPIEFYCPHCNKFLRTPDDKAGVGANCPGCGERITVPTASTASPPPIPPEEDVLGGVPKASSSSGPPPRPASEAMKVCPTCGERIKAAATICRYCGESQAGGGTVRVTPSRASGLTPHRGPMLLIFAILGWFFCCIFAIVAWVMANGDLAEMDAGRMDPEGRSLTQAGKYVGMAAVIIQGLVFLFYIGLVALMIAVEAAN